MLRQLLEQGGCRDPASLAFTSLQDVLLLPALRSCGQQQRLPALCGRLARWFNVLHCAQASPASQEALLQGVLQPQLLTCSPPVRQLGALVVRASVRL